MLKHRLVRLTRLLHALCECSAFPQDFQDPMMQYGLLLGRQPLIVHLAGQRAVPLMPNPTSPTAM